LDCLNAVGGGNEGEKKFYCLIFVLAIVLFSLQGVFALRNGQSNESIGAKQSIGNAELCFEDMQERKIPLERANESLQEAFQLYTAQFSLEEKGRKADYDLVLDYAVNVCEINEVAIEANDELNIFKETFEDAKEHINVSIIENDYKDI